MDRKVGSNLSGKGILLWSFTEMLRGIREQPSSPLRAWLVCESLFSPSNKSVRREGSFFLPGLVNTREQRAAGHPLKPTFSAAISAPLSLDARG